MGGAQTVRRYAGTVQQQNCRTQLQISAALDRFKLKKETGRNSSASFWRKQYASAAGILMGHIEALCARPVVAKDVWG